MSFMNFNKRCLNTLTNCNAGFKYQKMKWKIRQPYRAHNAPLFPINTQAHLLISIRFLYFVHSTVFWLDRRLDHAYVQRLFNNTAPYLMVRKEDRCSLYLHLNVWYAIRYFLFVSLCITAETSHPVDHWFFYTQHTQHTHPKIYIYTHLQLHT